MRAATLRTIIQSPSTIKYRKDPAAPIRVDFSNRQIEYCADISVLIERCDRSGYMAPFLSGMRWEAIPPAKQGQVSADIRKFRRELREGGYSVE